jgi:flagellum-specific peptidoglycan hydrolase FlgJ
VTKQFVAIREKSVAESVLDVIGIDISDEPDTVWFASPTFTYRDETWDKLAKPKNTEGGRIVVNKPRVRYNNPGDAASDYIAAYSDEAKNGAKEGVPAAITLAQGLLESGKGRSFLAKNANNHFGIKCHGVWKNCLTRKDDTPYDQFRVYASAKESFDDHINFLKRNDNYDKCFRCGNDIGCWLYRLRQSGYATDPLYDYKLAEIIDRYKLLDYELNYDRKKVKARL